MKRNCKLIYQILEALEKEDSATHRGELNIPDGDNEFLHPRREEVSYHCHLCADAGYIELWYEPTVGYFYGNEKETILTFDHRMRMTWQGHEKLIELAPLYKKDS